MHTATTTRAFKYNAIKLTDPDPALTVEGVREFYARIYPEIVSAAIEGPTNVNGTLTYTFAREVGTKGAQRTKAAPSLASQAARNRAHALLARTAADSSFEKPDAATVTAHNKFTRALNLNFHFALRGAHNADPHTVPAAALPFIA
jgi:PRTRC genetic system protein C